MMRNLGLGNAPDFHLEYASRYGQEKKQITKLKSVHNDFTFTTNFNSNSSIIASGLEEQTKEIFLQRWGTNAVEKDFCQFLETKPFHSIYEKKTKPYNTKGFQTMKNYNLPEWMFDFGKTHVSIGCVDFQQLLLGKLNQTEDGSPLDFYGIDSVNVSIARCWILYQMMRNGANPRSVLQVWFSTAWTDDAYGDFIKAVDDLLETKDKEEDIMRLLKHWKTAKLDVQKVACLWAKDIYKEGRNAPFEACANFE